MRETEDAPCVYVFVCVCLYVCMHMFLFVWCTVLPHLELGVLFAPSHCSQARDCDHLQSATSQSHAAIYQVYTILVL